MILQLFLALLAHGALSSPTPSDSSAGSSSSSHSNSSQPIVHLSYASYAGSSNTTTGVSKFLGMRFAAPAQRLRLPAPPVDERRSGVQDATKFAADCPQQNPSVDWTSQLPLSTLIRMSTMPTSGSITNQSEDCLYINVWAPSASLTKGKRLPVVAYLFGGGFEDGGASIYDGGAVVERSIVLNEPVLYVGFGYRVNAFGFLSGKEVKNAGVANIGLWDQLAALQWVNRNIDQFGGDHNKVSIWGQSAGSISVALQMIYASSASGPSLFRGAWMNSGSPTMAPPMDDAAGQNVYNTVVANAGCSGAKDTLDCLRKAPYDSFVKGMQANAQIFSFQSLNLTYRPRIDGRFIRESPIASTQKGNFAHIPIVSGDCDDEGTLFSLTNDNLTTTDELMAYLKQEYVPHATSAQLATLATLYPNDPAAGSPFDTGAANEIAPQFKRIAAISGDFVFQAPRRFFLSQAVKSQPVWSFLSKRWKDTQVLGAWHGSDLALFYGNAANGGDTTGLDRLINFVNNLDPNKGTKLSGPAWPQYSKALQMLQLSDAAGGAGTALDVTTDTYRQAPLAFDITLMLQNQ